MGITPHPGGGIVGHLSWLDERLGSSGTWLIHTTIPRPPGRRRHHQQVTDNVLATIGELTAGIPGSWGPDGCLEVTGPTIPHHHEAETSDAQLLEIDTIDLHLADPHDPIHHTVAVEALRLPHQHVAPLARLVDGWWDDWNRILTGSLIGAWHAARHRDPTVPIETVSDHRCWAAAGNTILTLIADHQPATAQRRRHIETAARRLLADHQLPPPAYGPLVSPDPARGQRQRAVR